MNDVVKSKIEMVRRHVREGERLAARQREIVADLPADDRMAQNARDLLATLESHRGHLRRIEGN